MIRSIALSEAHVETCSVDDSVAVMTDFAHVRASGRSERRGARHVASVQSGRIREVAPLELRGQLAQMLLDERNLSLVSGVLGRDRLKPAIRQDLETVRGQGGEPGVTGTRILVHPLR
jgi:hypothetical protein